MSIWAVLILAVGTFAIRYAGPMLRDRVELSKQTEEFLNRAATVVLVALVATSAIVVDGDGRAGPSPRASSSAGSSPGGRPRSPSSSSPRPPPPRCCGSPGSLEGKGKGRTLTCAALPLFSYPSSLGRDAVYQSCAVRRRRMIRKIAAAATISAAAELIMIVSELPVVGSCGAADGVSLGVSSSHGTHGVSPS